jgi:hypothetical protein
MPAQPPDLLVGSAAIREFLLELGLRADPYYLRRSKQGWPIGRSVSDRGSGGKLVASRRRLRKYIEEITRGPFLGKNFLVSKLWLNRHAKKTAANHVTALLRRRKRQQAAKPKAAAPPTRRAKVRSNQTELSAD